MLRRSIRVHPDRLNVNLAANDALIIHTDDKSKKGE